MVQALWRGSPNHYAGRRGYRVTHITLHIMCGWLWGTDSCFTQASFRAASHYGVGGDGTILQWVSEADGSWADANAASDCSGVTIEHEGGLAHIPVTDREIEASAQLCADIAKRYGWSRLWHDETGGRRGNVWLHREVPGTDHADCPDLAPNGLPVRKVIDRANRILTGATNTTEHKEDSMQAIIQPNGESRLVYFDGTKCHNLTHPDQVKALQQVAKAGGFSLPTIKLGTRTAPFYTRLLQALK
ncbi:N-acetylmuramoyl-L-alanine amidase [Bifidobacterium margollesii]|uniref:N-acetylmuramoyl-L-alanine amidase n=1 Tax=Bifidobacterium margollesii TaxID=2020964 RepID=A0A2N5JBP2_9BIFI|nr:N-acetylmuramoyl-L-alanine amidase [Bifidobacterium margollesii]PLS31626.1 N-acetylmuramoyl-L-alanine amidase [Bifidobacterium margollesii]